MGEIWISMFGGLLLGLIIGWASAWRMGLKLERVGVGLAEWDATDPRDPRVGEAQAVLKEARS
jgi:hypothetical protein